MTKRFLRFFILIYASFLLNLSGGECDAHSINSSDVKNKYISVSEYLKLHPEEQKLSEKFNRIVHEIAQPIPPSYRNKKITIAIVYPGEQVSDYWRRSLQSFEGRLQELRILYEIQQHFTKGGGLETRIQARILKQVLAENPDYLVFTLDVNRHKRLVERILAKGTPRLFLQNITTPLLAWEENQPFYVGFDHTTGSKMLADYFLEKYGSEGSYGLLYYSQGYVSVMRGDSFLHFMQHGKGPLLNASFYTNGSREKAQIATLNTFCKVKDLKFIYTCSTDVAFGAVDGLKEGGLSDEIAVNGWGGGAAELKAIVKGDLDVTVMRMNDDNGVAMAEAIRLEILGRESEVPTIFSGDFSLITGETSTEELKKLKRKAFRYSGISGIE